MEIAQKAKVGSFYQLIIKGYNALVKTDALQPLFLFFLCILMFLHILNIIISVSIVLFLSDKSRSEL